MQKPSISKGPSFRNLMNSNRGYTIPKQKTEYCGWLWKKGALNRTLANRRWFVIKGDQMYYFRDRTDSTPLGQIPLAGNKIKRHPPVADTNGKFIFEIIAGEEREGRPVVDNLDTLLFGTETPYEMEEWIKAINRVIYTPVGGGMFGRSIIETVKIDSRRGGGMVPIIVEQCVEYIRKHGLKEEGIFRVAGSQEDIEELKTAFNTGTMKQIDDDRFKVTAVASVLKKYIGDLPDPVIPSENYDQFVFIGGVYKTEPEEAIKKFHEALREIPKEHFDLLKYLSRFLFEISKQHEDVTKMSISNLALIFGPNLLRPTDENADVLLQSLSDVNRTTMAIVLAQERLFPKTEDERYYQPKDQKFEFNLLDFDNDVKTRSLPSSPQISPTLNLTVGKRSLSESSLTETILQNDYSDQDEVQELRRILGLERKQHEEKVHKLKEQLEKEMKLREMFILRLKEEHKARVQAEERVELYRSGIEDYCKKFGHADISFS